MKTNGEGVYVIWNPSTMEITGTMPHPDVGQRPGLIQRSSLTNRGVVVQDGKLYHPYYWSDEKYTRYAPDSRIAIIDVVNDKVLGITDAPCSGLDIATKDEAGNLYFSSWTGQAGLALALGAPAPCGVKMPAGSDQLDPTWTVRWPALTEGRQGAALRYQGEGKALLSVFHHERVTIDATTDAIKLVATPNWRVWQVDLTTRAARPIEGIDWNSGATYFERINGLAYMLVPNADYKTSKVYEIADTQVRPLFDTRGWAIRLFKVR